MEPFLHQVATDLIARFGDELKAVAIIFNNKRPVSFLKKHLGEILGHSFWSPSFFTVGEFFQLSSETLVADPLKQFFILHQEYVKLLEKEGKPGISPDQFFRMGEIILSDFAQIDYDLVNATALFTELEDISVIRQQFAHFTAEQQQFLEQFWASFSADSQRNQQQRFIDLWKRMPPLYTAFHSALKDEHLITTAQLYRQLALRGADKPSFTNNYKQLVFVGFNALNKAEQQLFRQWQAEGKALFYFDADAYYLGDALQEAGLFIRRNILSYGLVNALGDAPDLLRHRETPVTVIRAQGHTAQAKTLAGILNKYPASATDGPEKTAIILADESLLLPVLQTIPDDAGRVNITMGYPFAQSAVFGLIELWINVQEQIHAGIKSTVYYRDVLAFLSHPLTGVKPAERDRLQQEIISSQNTEVPVTSLHFASPVAPNFFTIKHRGVQSIEALYLMLKAVLEQRQKAGQLKELEAAMLIEVCKKLNILHDGVESHASTLGLSFVFLLIKKALSGLSVPLEGEPLRGIQVMGLLESRCLDFDRVIVLGADEGVLPKTGITATFIPDSLRRAYGLPVPENQDAISAYLFYRLLQHSNDIVLVYNNLVTENSSGEASRFIRQLEFESNLQFSYQQHQQPVKIEPSRQISIAKKGKVWDALKKFIYNGSVWDTRNISATALTTYLNCSLEFFYRYLAKLEEPKEVPENLEAGQIGSALHQVLEWFYRDLAESNALITTERIRDKLGSIPQLAREALSFVLFENKTRLHIPNSMQQIVLHIVAEYVNAILFHDMDIAPFSIVELENKKDYKYLMPLTVNGKTEQVQLYGIIDRVDEHSGKLRIVDYKTGSDELKFSSLDELFEPDGKKQNKAVVQTLFYTFIYEQVRHVSGVEPNLYAVRKMRGEGTRFSYGSRPNVVLEAPHLEDFKAGFKNLLQTTLEDIFNANLPFRQTQNPDNCTYCPYREMCIGG